MASTVPMPLSVAFVNEFGWLGDKWGAGERFTGATFVYAGSGVSLAKPCPARDQGEMTAMQSMQYPLLGMGEGG